MHAKPTPAAASPPVNPPPLSLSREEKITAAVHRTCAKHDISAGTADEIAHILTQP